MNCSQQQPSNGALAATNMTTLLQKNCIKTLTVNNLNNVVVVGAAPVGNAATLNANVPITGVVTPQTHMIVGQAVANTSHVQPTDAQPHLRIMQNAQPHLRVMQNALPLYHPQLQTGQQQTQYIIYNPSDGTMFRTATPSQQQHHQPTIVAVTQHQQNFVTQNNIPKPFSSTTPLTVSSMASTQHQQQQQQHHIHNNSSGDRNGSRTLIASSAINQPKVLNIVPTTLNHHQPQQLHQPQQQHQQNTSVVASLKSIENTNFKHINKIEPTPSSENSLAHHQIIQNGTEITDNNTINNSTRTAAAVAATTTAAAATTTATTTTNSTNTNTNDINKQSNNTTQITNCSGSAAIANSNENSSHSNVANEECVTPTNTKQQQPQQQSEQAATEEAEQDEPEIDIVINNVVCSFSVRCHLNLREIALNGRNVEFRRENGMVTMKLRRPYTTASIWSSGRITCTGATSEDQAKVGARRYARCLQALGFPVRFNNFRVVNVLGTCSMPWAIKIVNFSEKFKKDASYEPELHPGVTYKLKTPKATLKIFSTGSITVTAGSVADVQSAIEHIFPLVYEFRKKRTTEALPPAVVYDPDNDEELTELSGNRRPANKPAPAATKKKAIKRKYPFGHAENDPTEDNMCVSDDEDDIDDVDDEDDEMDDDL